LERSLEEAGRTRGEVRESRGRIPVVNEKNPRLGDLGESERKREHKKGKNTVSPVQCLRSDGRESPGLKCSFESPPGRLLSGLLREGREWGKKKRLKR